MTILAPWCIKKTPLFERHLGQTGRALLPALALRKNLHALDIGHP